jgi:hypothetical protein
MTLEFAIRDDDCSYFTDVSELEQAYAELPETIPVSFAVVPYRACEKNPAVPETHWENDEKRPIGENTELVEYLRAGLEDGSLSVALHGYTHERIDRKPEFVAASNPLERIQEGRNHLESVFDQRITVFVPPNNSLSSQSITAVKKSNLQLCYYPTPVSRPKNVDVSRMFVRDLWFKYRHKTGGPISFIRDANRFWRQEDRSVFMPVRPWPYNVQGGAEFTCVSMTQDASTEPIKKQISVAAENDGKFCLAIHYHSFRSNGFRRRFYELIEHVRSTYDVEFIQMEKLFE